MLTSISFFLLCFGLTLVADVCLVLSLSTLVVASLLYFIISLHLIRCSS